MTYTRNYFTLDGKSSADFNAWIAESTMFNGAEHDDSTVDIPGRNGAVVFSNGRYKNFTATLSCYIPDRMRENVDGLRAWLSTKWDYVRYQEAYKPGEFRLVRYKGGFTLSHSDRVGAAFNLKFDCKPQRFLESGEIPVTFSGSGSLYNATLYEALPLIRCNGTGGTVTINGVKVTVTGCTNHVTLDCDIMEAYEGTANRNGTTTLNNGKFPTLVPGNNAVSFTGFSSVVITPRYYTI